MPLLGAHMSIAGGYFKAAEAAATVPHCFIMPNLAKRREESQADCRTAAAKLRWPWARNQVMAALRTRERLIGADRVRKRQRSSPNVTSRT
jgi:hypothetical protein